MVSEQTCNEALAALAASFFGQVGFFAKDLSSGATFTWNAELRFPTASVVKLPIMTAMYRMAERGELSMDERCRVEADICRHGTGLLSMLSDGPELMLRDFCRLMIAVSDNIATDVIVRRLGCTAVNAEMDALGLANVEMGRWHYDMVGMGKEPMNPANSALAHQRVVDGVYNADAVAFSDSLKNNAASAREMARLLELLERGKVCGPANTAEMLAHLKACTSKDKIPLHLRPDIVVAHKIGASHRIKADAGIAYLPTGPLVVVGFTLADKHGPAGNPLIADMTRVVVEAVCPSALKPESLPG